MKKLISLILAIVMICACALSVSAFSPIDPESEEGKRREEIRVELESSLKEYIFEQTGVDSVTRVELLFCKEEYKLISFYTNVDTDKEYFYRMGIFAVRGHKEQPVFKDGFAVYAESDKQWHPLSYLFNKDNYALYDLCNWDMWGETQNRNEFNFVTHFAIMGTPDITMVSIMQKYLAGMDVSADITAEEVQYIDIDNDGIVTIKDASALQRALVGLDILVYDSVA